MINPIGVMQGRLLPKYQGRYQAHPVGYWQDEFYIASKNGLDCIEFILDFNDAEINPLLKNATNIPPSIDGLSSPSSVSLSFFMYRIYSN